ncbi:PadR family transcriptional regulator [Halegenticoccus tardaugens]|uniref:PadR family transcriptional regulator n=1 Tax=Halegenticoccus tardaugens TaxID=2071624 RepID=UPI00100C1BE8|nr:PadR family transcriptional regulator [Halegenticoccus tardaugens]
MSLFDLSGFQRDLLFVIAGHGNPSGQEIKEDLEGSLGEEINHGRLYPNLDTLVQNDYVEKGTIDRRTNSYTITDQGRELLRERHEWENQYLEEAAQIDA